jgi:dihydroxyacetone kinase-like protein
MHFDMAREMSGKSIASAIAGDDAAVRTSIFSTGRRGVARQDRGCGCRRGTRPCARASAIASMRYALDRHPLRSRMVPEAGKPAFAIA